MDLAGKTYYEILGVEPSATLDEIREAYRDIAKVYHPDSHHYDEILQSSARPVRAATSKNEDELFKAVTTAYNILIDRERRQQYDGTLRSGSGRWLTPHAVRTRTNAETNGSGERDAAAAPKRERKITSSFNRFPRPEGAEPELGSFSKSFGGGPSKLGAVQDDAVRQHFERRYKIRVALVAMLGLGFASLALLTIQHSFH